ncbi:Lrp/AsnC family transcriptional regulator [Pseudomaricurvus sp. HS19]|uniref:Lrp/AsnC family transcriptional regulator n=1 Tax=Pseudomaricurvus sp. HS19 TaxID=2692626 RepID=UPI00136C1B86|nr:Lrp/AsnC family transcriptional regulator [Pseudomaricurvus sp. HS19]MYM63077.1 winged helix-turn-helix transcriptional regulator [Pseudomaricurvus sp. HS19]
MADTHQLDDFDIKILRALQENADYSMNELGDLVGLSHTPCWRRIKRLENDGFIRGKVTLLDAKMLRLGVTVHAYLTIKSHDETSLNAFETAVQEVREIVECYSTTGDKDYMLRVVVESVDHYEQLLKQTLVHLPNVASINSTFALKQVKYTTALPLESASRNN